MGSTKQTSYAFQAVGTSESRCLNAVRAKQAGKWCVLIGAALVSFAAFVIPYKLASQNPLLLSEEGVRTIYCSHPRHEVGCAPSAITVQAAGDAAAWAVAATTVADVCPELTAATIWARYGMTTWASAAVASAEALKAQAAVPAGTTVRGAADAALVYINRSAMNGASGPKSEQLKVYGELRRLSEREDVQFRGFFGHIQMYMHSWMILVLGILLFLTCARLGSASPLCRCDCATAVLFGLVLFATVHGPHLIRALYVWPKSDEGRRIVSYLHLDISLTSFCWDQTFFLFVCCQVALLCRLWFRIYREAPEEGAPPRLDPPLAALRDFSHTFHRWQIESALLAAAFLYLTVVYWRLIWKYQSTQHVISAVLTHALWAVAWVYASLPLMRSWDKWQSARWAAIGVIHKEMGKSHSHPHPQQRVETLNARLGLLQSLHPIGVWTVVASVIVAIGSFLAPVKVIADDL